MFPIRNTVPTRYPAVATWTLIFINCAVFFIQLGLTPAEQEDFILTFALVPARYFLSGDVSLSVTAILPFFTMMFLHGGWLYLILNMWMLWLFGPAIEDRLGHGTFLLFYLVCGVAAAFAHVFFNPTSAVPALGASGAIAGVLGCFVRLFPLARLVVLVPIVFIPLFFGVPALVFVGIWFILQILQGTAELLTPSSGGGVAWWAHIGGFAAGLAIGPVLRRSVGTYRPYYADEGILGFDPSGRR